jgi:hypothetical protein
MEYTTMYTYFTNVLFGVAVTINAGFDSWQGQEFSFFDNVQTGFGDYPASYPLGKGSSSLGVKQARTLS